MSPAVQALLQAMAAMAALAAAGWALAYRPDLSPAALERHYAGAASRFLEVDGLRIHYRDEGRGQPVVLLHGLTDSLFVWDAWAPLLAERFRIIRLDLPGHGLTGPDPAGRCDWRATADLVARFLDRLGIARASLVGSSFGGAIAWQIAALHPDRVQHLVLVAPVAYTAGGCLPWLLRLLAHPLTGPLLARLTPRRAFADRARQVWADPQQLDPAMLERQYRLFRRAGNRAALGAILRAGRTLETEPLLARITAPTLLVWGAADPVLPPGNAQRLASAIRGAQVVTIPGAGHVPMLERPELGLAAVRDFLASAHPARP
jgi:pimeloyl-ACP methyl ester carboxylesterase